MDYSVIVPLVVDIMKSALPVGIVFILAERLTQIFFHFAFPKLYK